MANNTQASIPNAIDAVEAAMHDLGNITEGSREQALAILRMAPLLADLVDAAAQRAAISI